MKSLWHKIHVLSDKLHMPNLPNWLLGILALIFILRIPSFFEPYYYGDEMVYLTLGQSVRQGLTLYKDIHDNKPPLLYLTAAVAGNLFWFKVILAFWNVLTIIIFYKLAKFLFEKNQKAQKISTFLFALLTTLPFLEGLTVNSELFMIVFTILGLLMLLKNNVKSKEIFLAGILFGLGTLFKIPAAFDAPIIVFYWLITDGFSNWRKILKDTFILVLGFLTPLLITFVWYFFKGALPEYINAAFLQNIGYVSSFRPGDVQKPFLVRNAPLLIRGLIVLVCSSILYFLRKKLSKKFILFSLWTLFGLFAITLSERPYPHYLIQIIAPVSFLFATFFADKSLEQSLVVIPLTVAFFVPVYYKFWFYPTTSYYLRFINFAVHRETKSQYFDGFSSTTNKNYAIAQFLATSSKTSDRVFMWSPDSAAVYALAKRLPPIKYVVDYHINDYSTKAREAKNIAASPPKFIILTDDYPYMELKPLIKQKYILINKIGNANIFSRIDFAPGK
jgi:4-amino-4-deoxy-L-arabinose transferase-like glycosyltransferase